MNPLGYDEGAPTSFTVSAGHYKSETAVALGLNHYFSRDVLVSVGGTISKGDNMVNASVAMRLGRKKVEEVTTTSELAQLKQQLQALTAEVERLKKQ